MLSVSQLAATAVHGCFKVGTSESVDWRVVRQEGEMLFEFGD